MSDSYLPKIFEGFPELADKAKALESAIAELTHAAQAATAPASEEDAVDAQAFAALEGERNDLRAQLEALQSTAENAPAVPDNSEELGALKEEVAHWKDKYDALAGRFDEDLASAKAENTADAAGNEEKTAQIAALEQAKETAAAEIARLAADLAASRNEVQAKDDQMADLNTQLSNVQAELSKTEEDGGASASDVPSDAVLDLEARIAALSSEVEDKQALLAEANAKAEASEAARSQAAARLNALIDGLNDSLSAGAA